MQFKDDSIPAGVGQAIGCSRRAGELPPGPWHPLSLQPATAAGSGPGSSCHGFLVRATSHIPARSPARRARDVLVGWPGSMGPSADQVCRL
jgi:hypothetical protein